MRVQRRALSDALNALINAYESGSASSAAEETSSADGVAASDAYAVIFLHLAASWKDGSLFGPLRALNKMVSGAMLIVLAGIAVTAIAFGCVTAWQIFVVAWYLNYYAVLLLSVAAFNSRIHILTDLLCTAQLPIRDRLLAIARYGDTEAAAAKELAAHDARLDALWISAQ
ncbi:hypothetical protein DFJ74DRAFT_700683 [Hyaloraphidium curvatum]|nr:hypothetical protein DFJ74DRAFT_700683 [Hyaloraphidium curvatum]